MDFPMQRANNINLNRYFDEIYNENEENILEN